jgi:hypothetical protein
MRYFRRLWSSDLQSTNFMYDIDAHYLWAAVRAAVNEQIGSSILAHTIRTHLDQMRFKMYGIFFRKIDHQYSCGCGDEIKHTHQIVNKIAFSIFKSRGGNRIPYDVEFGPLDNAPACMACGEK